MEKEVRVTTASQKGQVVIPQEIREELGIESGTKFAVYGRGDTIIFKRIEVPTAKDFEKLATFGRKFAKKKGIKEKDVSQDSMFSKAKISPWSKRDRMRFKGE